MKPKIGEAPKYPAELVTTVAPNFSCQVNEVPLGEEMHKAFADAGAVMMQAWEHVLDSSTGLCCIVAGEPIEEAVRGVPGQKRWHLSVSVKDKAGWYVRWPTEIELQSLANTFFVPHLQFEVDAVETKGRPIVNLWCKARFNRYHRAGVSESEG